MHKFSAVPSLALAALLLSPGPAAAQELVRGDVVRGGQLYRLECAACHGPDAKGDPTWRRALSGKEEKLGTLPDLSDSAFLVQRSDAELMAAIRDGAGKGGAIPGHRFRGLSTLDRLDLVAWLRRDRVTVDDFFPGAGRFTAKDFQIDQWGVERLEKDAKVQVSEAEREVVVLTVYTGQRGKTEQPRLIPWTPVELDLLSARERLGYLSFVELEVPRSGERIKVALAFDLDGKLLGVKVDHADPAKKPGYEKALAAFVGQGGKTAMTFKAPRGLRDGALWARAMDKAASLAIEGIVMFEKSERARTAFDR